MNTVLQAASALKSMGDNSQSLATFLGEREVTGYRKSDHSNPLARYLNGVFDLHRQYFAVTSDEIILCPEDRAVLDSMLHQSRVVKQFLCDFDKGAYPELDADMAEMGSLCNPQLSFRPRFDVVKVEVYTLTHGSLVLCRGEDKAQFEGILSVIGSRTSLAFDSVGSIRLLLEAGNHMKMDSQIRDIFEDTLNILSSM